MPDPQTDVKKLLAAYRQPAITPFITECLKDFDKNTYGGFFCLLLGHCVHVMDNQAALMSAQRTFANILSFPGTSRLSDKETTELAVAFLDEKVEAAKCYECRSVFLRLVNNVNPEDFCHVHQQRFIKGDKFNSEPS